MLHMANRKLGLFIYFFLNITLYSGVQTIDIGLDLAYEGASVNNMAITENYEKTVIDLGFLQQGVTYSNVKIGTFTVKISQKMDSTDPIDGEGCMLGGMDIDGVNLNTLKKYSETLIARNIRYVGSRNNSIRLKAGDVKIISTVGNLDPAMADEYYLVAPECLGSDFVIDGLFTGVALVSLQYQFTLYADITGDMSIGSVGGAFYENDMGVGLSVKDLIINQLLNSNIPQGKRRR